MEPPGLSRRRLLHIPLHPLRLQLAYQVALSRYLRRILDRSGDGSPIAPRELVPERDHGGFQTFRAMTTPATQRDRRRRTKIRLLRAVRADRAPLAAKPS
jgi:hypothetical protein